MSDRTDFSITFQIESRLDQIRLLRAALSGVLGHFGVVESEIHSLGLAVAEIANNSFEHGYKGAEDQQLEVRIQLDNSEIQIDVIDYAPLFPQDQRFRLEGDPLPLEDPSEEWTIRGHGLQIVRQVVDSIDLVRQPGQNRITLRKRVAVKNN